MPSTWLYQSVLQLTFDLFRRPPVKITGLVPDEILRGQAADLLQKIECPDLASRVEVVWNSRLTTTAGQAQYRDRRIILNPRLREFGDAEIDRTLRHELAHLLAHHRAGRRRIAPHGPEWRQACQDLGMPDETRCHALPMKRRTVRRKYLYLCAHCHSSFPRVKTFRKKVACLQCCRVHNQGRYDERFLLRLARKL